MINVPDELIQMARKKMASGTMIIPPISQNGVILMEYNLGAKTPGEVAMAWNNPQNGKPQPLYHDLPDYSPTAHVVTPVSGLNCDDPNCTCNKGVSGLGCGCNKVNGLSGLDGLSIDTTGLVTGAIIGAVVGHFAGWGWQVSAGIGAVVNGFVIPSMTS